MHLEHYRRPLGGSLWGPRAPELLDSPSTALAKTDRLDLVLIYSIFRLSYEAPGARRSAAQLLGGKSAQEPAPMSAEWSIFAGS